MGLESVFIMALKESYKNLIIKIFEGRDDINGKYIKYKRLTERPCYCHPETCPHQDGKILVTEIYLDYEDGTRAYLT